MTKIIEIHKCYDCPYLCLRWFSKETSYFCTNLPNVDPEHGNYGRELKTAETIDPECPL